MANQVAARLKGDDYQHLYSWYLALDLLRPGSQVARVVIENEKAWSADDVTLEHTAESGLPDYFYQIKQHSKHSKSHSTAQFIEQEGQESSQLQKLFRTWRNLKTQAKGRPIEIHFISTWTWDSTDKLKNCVSAENNAFTDDFYRATPRSDIGKLRQQWFDHLGLTPADIPEFFEFAGALRLWPGFANWEWMKRLVKERMGYLRLKSDEATLLVAVGIVRAWIKSGTQIITTDILHEVFTTHGLYLPPDEEPSVHVYLTTIKDQRFDIDPDFLIDWRHHFLGKPTQKGHSLADLADWNRTLLPELEDLEEKINTGTSCRLVRARGLARLSAWSAFGFTFSEVNRYTIEVDQQGQHWRTDAEPSPDFSLVLEGPTSGEVIDEEGTAVAVGISVSGSLANDVRRDLEHRREKVASLLLVRASRELGHDCLRGAGDAVALANSAKSILRDFANHWRATRLLLYYFGPLAGACFIGHRLNAVCREIQIMENQQPGYAPSFLLQS
jgi:hypothetical protein